MALIAGAGYSAAAAVSPLAPPKAGAMSSMKGCICSRTKGVAAVAEVEVEDDLVDADRLDPLQDVNDLLGRAVKQRVVVEVGSFGVIEPVGTLSPAVYFAPENVAKIGYWGNRPFWYLTGPRALGPPPR